MSAPLSAVRAVPAWSAAVGLAAVLVVTGAVPWAQAGQTTQRLAPLLVFLVAATVLAELTDAAGVFDRAAAWAARGARGRTRVLYVLMSLVAVAVTVVLGLDATAVLLTPVVLAVARRIGSPPWPWALATVWLANTASLLLPVSNLTNLLAAERLGLDARSFATLLWPAALTAIAGTILVLTLTVGRQVRGRYAVMDAPPVADRGLLVVASACCAALVVLTLAGLPLPAVAAGCATVLAAVTAVRRPAALRTASLVPWRLCLLVVGLFVIVTALLDHGLAAWTAAAAGDGDGLGALVRLAGLGALTSNAVNNLPAYLALEPTAAEPMRTAALLVGVNVGPVVTLWGSLATMLWWDRCRARGIPVSARRFAGSGAVLALVLVPLAVLALSWKG
ncbi:MAG: hypothetical protein EPO13_08180 [Actinomycetota bacterium]|nr:MAG: hypothetical protein EPO13_08180 [Actinomycetota bacterium]